MHQQSDPTTTCACCGETFDPSEARHFIGPVEGWVSRQRLGPLHGKCRYRPDAYPPKAAAFLRSIVAPGREGS